MTKNNDIKKAIALVFTYFTVLLIPKVKVISKESSIKYNDDFNENSICFAEYDNKKIYIGNEELIASLIEDYDNDNNIYIIDTRSSRDPNMSIRNSYKIDNKEDVKIVLRIIQEYNNRYPSNWNRTYYSTYLEVLAHYYGYVVGIKKESATHVDLNNADENKYKSTILTYILK